MKAVGMEYICKYSKYVHVQGVRMIQTRQPFRAESIVVTVGIGGKVGIWILLIIHRMPLNKNFHMKQFYRKNRFRHVLVRLSILFISGSQGPSKAEFKEFLFIRGRTRGNIWKNRWLMTSLQSLVTIMQNPRHLCRKFGSNLKVHGLLHSESLI